MWRSFIFFCLLFLVPGTGFSAAKRVFKDVFRCQLNEGYELVLQRKDKSYYLAMVYGSKPEFRTRLKAPNRLIIERDRNHVLVELRPPDSADYLVHMSAQFDEDAASFNEMVHYKLTPTQSAPESFKLYEAAGDGLPLKNLGCHRP